MRIFVELQSDIFLFYAQKYAPIHVIKWEFKLQQYY